MSSNNVTDIFVSFQTYIEGEQVIREEIRTATRDLEQTARNILTVAQSVHQPDGITKIPFICSKMRESFETVRKQFGVLVTKVPDGQYYRFHDHWRFICQRLTFLSSLLIYLETEKLATRDQVSEIIGVSARSGDGFHFDLDDYLMGLLQLASELSRLAVNSVTAGDYSRPHKLAKFVGELDSGFRLLNLKNDSLRKRFDGLKYDLKKIEEVLYDITIRGLSPKDSSEELAQITTQNQQEQEK